MCKLPTNPRFGVETESGLGMAKVDWASAPEYIRALPLAHRRMIAAQCDGDWRRCTRDEDGGVTIHNRPQMTRTELAPAGQTAKVLKRKGPVPKAPKTPLRRVQLVNDRQGSADRSMAMIPPEPLPEIPAAQESVDFAPTFSSGSVVAWSSDKDTVIDPATKIRVLPGCRSNGRGILAEPEDERMWRDANEWENTVGYVMRRCANGVPPECDLQVFDGVLAMWGIDLNLIESVARNPEHVVVAPESFEKKYPVLRFRRGDVLTVIGFQRPRTPSIIAAYVSAKLLPDDGKPQRATAGGGGSRKRDGLPTRPSTLLRALKTLGAQLDIDLATNRAVVTFQGNDLGQVDVGEGVPKETCISSYQRMQRKIHAIAARDA